MASASSNPSSGVWAYHDVKSVADAKEAKAPPGRATPDLPSQKISVIIKAQNTRLAVALQTMQKSLTDIDAKLFTESKKEELQNTIADILRRMPIANNIGFMNLDPLITRLKSLNTEVYARLGFNLKDNNPIGILLDYIGASLENRVRQKILPRDLLDQKQAPALAAEIRNNCAAPSSVHIAIDLLEKLWQMSTPKSKYKTKYKKKIFGLDIDGTGINAFPLPKDCKDSSVIDMFNIDDFLWRYIIDNLSDDHITELVLASWRMTQESDAFSAKESGTIEFFKYIIPLIERIKALGYPITFNPALLSDLLQNKPHGYYFYNQDRDSSASVRPDFWPDKIAKILFIAHCVNRSEDGDGRVSISLYDDTDIICDRVITVLANWVKQHNTHIIPRNVDIECKNYCEDDENSVQDPAKIVFSGTGVRDEKCCHNKNFLLQFSPLADVLTNSFDWANSLNENLRYIIDRIGERILSLRAEALPGKEALYNEIKAVSSQTLSLSMYNLSNYSIFDLSNLLNFLCRQPDPNLPQNFNLAEFLQNHGQMAQTLIRSLISYINSIAAFLKVSGSMNPSLEKVELDRILMLESKACSAHYAELGEAGSKGDTAAKMKMAYLLSYGKSSDFGAPEDPVDRLQMIEELYFPALLADEKSELPADIYGCLLGFYYQNNVYSVNIFHLLSRAFTAFSNLNNMRDPNNTDLNWSDPADNPDSSATPADSSSQVTLFRYHPVMDAKAGPIAVNSGSSSAVTDFFASHNNRIIRPEPAMLEPVRPSQIFT